MIKIDINNIDSIKQQFLENVKSRNRTGVKNASKRKKGDVNDANKLFNEFVNNLDEIVLCPVNDFAKLKQNFSAICSKSSLGFKLFKEYMIGQYNSFMDDHGYWLSQSLNINVCPYCNRQYTFTVIKQKGNKGARPQFDHFLSKSEYPYFALSFYNLIPSCPTCNQAKGDAKIDINPYASGFDSDCKFVIDKIEHCILSGNREKWNISLPTYGTHQTHVSAFVLDELYNQHKDYVEEIVIKAQSYNKGYYDDLKTSFVGLDKLSERDINLLIFGNYIFSDDYNKRPLSKLTADILEQLEVKL